MDAPTAGDSGGRAVHLESGVPVVAEFISRLPRGDVLALGASDADVVAIAAHGVPVAHFETGAGASAIRATGAVPPGLVRRRLHGGRLPYPPRAFAGCWVGDRSGFDAPSLAGLLVQEGIIAHVTGQSAGLTRVTGQEASIVTERAPEVRAGDEEPSHADDCVFCPALRFRLNRIAALAGASGILWGDEQIFVVPDLAPLASGHLLVVTTRHHACVGAGPPSTWAAVGRARDEVSRLFRTVYGTRTLVFEHGPAEPQGAGACIDHAHWHCVPANARIRPLLEADGLRSVPADFATLGALYTGGRSYLYVEEEGRRSAFPVERLPSQFLRKAALSSLGDGQTPAVPYRWQEVFASAASRGRFAATLERLIPAVDDARRRAAGPATSGGSR